VSERAKAVHASDRSATVTGEIKITFIYLSFELCSHNFLSIPSVFVWLVAGPERESLGPAALTGRNVQAPDDRQEHWTNYLAFFCNLILIYELLQYSF
jgi:hypothetical protein